MKLVALVLALEGERPIDFVLANLVNSGISTIYVLAQRQPRSLIRHIDTMWGAIGAGGRIRVLLPRAQRYDGSADAVYQNLDSIERHQPDAVAVLAMERVYRMDLREMAHAHRQRGAYATVGALAVPIEEARSLDVVATDAGGLITQFQERPQRPAPLPGDPARAYASIGSYLLDPDVLAGLLLWARKEGGSDFGRDILPVLASCPRVFAYDFERAEARGAGAPEEAAYRRRHIPRISRNASTEIRSRLRAL